MEETVNVLKWAIFVNGVVLILAVLHAFLNSKRIKSLEKRTEELSVLVFTNPHTDKKLAEYFTKGRNLVQSKSEVISKETKWKPHHW